MGSPALEQTLREKKKKSTVNKLPKLQTKIFKETNLLDDSRTSYVINDCDVRSAVSVANLKCEGRKCLFCDQQLSEPNNAAEPTDKLQQLYIYENHSYKANLLIRDNEKFWFLLFLAMVVIILNYLYTYDVLHVFYFNDVERYKVESDITLF